MNKPCDRLPCIEEEQRFLPPFPSSTFPSLIASKAMADEMNQELRIKLVRIVSMLARMAMKFENISEPETAYAISANYDFENDCDYEDRLWLSMDRK